MTDALPSGSYLALTHWAAIEARLEAERKAGDLAREMSSQQYSARGKTEIARFFDGLGLAEPGLTQIQDRRPDPGDGAAVGGPVLLGAVARKG